MQRDAKYPISNDMAVVCPPKTKPKSQKVGVTAVTSLTESRRLATDACSQMIHVRDVISQNKLARR